MKFSTQHQLLYYLILMSAIGNCVQGKARFIQVPPNPLYVPSGETARFSWDYTVDNRTEEFQLFSPTWKYYANGTAVIIGYEHSLRDWEWIITYRTCPVRLLNPTVRVNKESTATLVISNVTTNDSGFYEMVLLLKTTRKITSKIQLLVTTQPTFISQLKANNSVLEGRELSMNCSATGIPTPNITWVLLKDQTKEIKSQGIGYADLIIQNITRHQNGTYLCQATNNPNEPPVENLAGVTVLYKPHVRFLNWTVDVRIVLLCLASGQPHPLIQWYLPSGMQVVSGVTTITSGSKIVIEIPEHNVGLYGVYKCNATNEVGWQVGYINITQKRPQTITETNVTVISKRDVKSTAATITRPSSITSITTPHLDRDATTQKNGLEKGNHKINLDIVVFLCVFGVLIPIAITVSGIFVLRKRQQRINKEHGADAAEDRNIRLNSVLPVSSNTATYAEVRNIPIYAQVDSSNKRTDIQSDNMPIYAQVDKTKKRRPGQIIYAELEDIKSSTETPCVIIPPSYHAAEYAEIKYLHNQLSVISPEPIYDSLPDRF